MQSAVLRDDKDLIFQEEFVLHIGHFTTQSIRQEGTRPKDLKIET